MIAGMERKRIHLQVTGIVQGVGFRPYVHKLVEKLSLAGWVRNTAAGAEIALEGDAAALAAFVEENSAGIAIGSLSELKEQIDTVSPEAYAQMRKNAAMIGQKLRAGYYTRRALDRIVSMAEVERG